MKMFIGINDQKNNIIIFSIIKRNVCFIVQFIMLFCEKIILSSHMKYNNYHYILLKLDINVKDENLKY